MPAPAYMSPQTMPFDAGVAGERPPTVEGLTLSAGYWPPKQSLSNWCWAAVTSFVAKICLDLDVPQCRVVECCKGFDEIPDVPVYCPPVGVPDQRLDVQFKLDLSMQAALGITGVRLYAIQNMASVREAIIGQLRRAHVIPLFIAWDGPLSGHYVCIFNAKMSGNILVYATYDPNLYDDGDNDPVEYFPESAFANYQGYRANGSKIYGSATIFYAWQ